MTDHIMTPASDQAVPSGEVVAWMVYGNYTRQPFGMLSSAEAYMRGLLKSDPDGGYHIRPLRYATPPATDVGAVGDAFEQAFNLIFETYSKPADNFNDDEQWAIWQHGKVTKAFTLLQQVRAARAKGASDEVDCTCA